MIMTPHALPASMKPSPSSSDGVGEWREMRRRGGFDRAKVAWCSSPAQIAAILGLDRKKSGVAAYLLEREFIDSFEVEIAVP